MERMLIWKRIIHWWVFVVVFLFVFWLIWYFIADKTVPAFSQIKIDFYSIHKVIILPFSVSRWWDLLAVIVWPLFFIKTHYYGDKINRYFFYPIIWDNSKAISIACGIIIGGILLNIWVVTGFLIPVFIALLIMLVVEIIFENIVWDNSKITKNRTKIFLPEKLKILFLMNLWLSLCIGLGLIFTIGFVPGLIISFISFVILLIMQYVIIYFSRGLYYFLKHFVKWLVRWLSV